MSKSYHKQLTEEDVVEYFIPHATKDHRREKRMEMSVKKKKRVYDDEDYDT